MCRTRGAEVSNVSATILVWTNAMQRVNYNFTRLSFLLYNHFVSEPLYQEKPTRKQNLFIFGHCQNRLDPPPLFSWTPLWHFFPKKVRDKKWSKYLKFSIKGPQKYLEWGQPIKYLPSLQIQIICTVAIASCRMYTEVFTFCRYLCCTNALDL